MGLLKVIEWIDNSKNTIVHRVEFKDNTINKGSMLTVRDGQVAIFADKGKMADVFLPGSYKLDTSSLPVLTKLLSWKYGFEKPFKSDIYFVRTTQFIDQKWGTTNPIILKDRDYGAIRVRGYGSYSFRVDDAFVLMQELSGSGNSYGTNDIVNYLKSLIVTSMTTALAKQNVPILELAASLADIAGIVKESIQDTFKGMGIALVNFNVENFSLPEELEKMLDKTTSMNMIRGSMDVYTQMAAADAMRDAAKNPGLAGATIGAGLGAGMGLGLGNMFANNISSTQSQVAQGNSEMCKCAKCGASNTVGYKFCRECGAPSGVQCPSCKAVLKADAKFCPECGFKMTNACAKCGASLEANAKFCGECGTPVNS